MRTEDFTDESTNCAWDAGGMPAADVLNSVVGGAGDRLQRVMRTVEAEIVPRLMMARRTRVQRTVASSEALQLVDGEEVAELVKLLLLHDSAVALGYVEAMRQQGMSPQNICLQLLAPAARRLGVMWEEDECDFMQVTLGLCHLHQVLHRMNAEFTPGVDETEQPAPRRVLLACLPGEQHTFGVVMVGQFLRRDGWDVWNEFPADSDELLDTVRSNSFTLVGLSVGSEARLDLLAKTVKAVRRTSRNRSVCVMVGGPIFATEPELAAVVGADTSAADGVQAAAWARTRFGSSVSAD